MALDATELAEAVRDEMGFPDTDPETGDPIPTSTEIVGWAQALVDELTTNAQATFGGVATPHALSGMDGSSLADGIKDGAGYPDVKPQLLSYATSIVTFIEASAVVTYTGPTPSTGNPDWFLEGTIAGPLFTGPLMAAAVAAAVPFPFVSTELLNKCTAIVNYIQANAEVEGNGTTNPTVS